MRARYWRLKGLGLPSARRAHPKAASEPAPLVDVPSGHPWYEEALLALRPYERHELGGPMDAVTRDLLQEWALARVEGREPQDALATCRKRYAKDRAMLIHGLVLVDGLER